MIIAIDGPAGAGKSTTARALAERFGFAYIDTGGMYRALALCALERGLEDAQIGLLAEKLPLHFAENGRRIFVDERDVSEEIRSAAIGEKTSQIAIIPAVRAAIVAQQRRLGRAGEAETGGAVLEGRDIQTVVFPDAEVKVFLDAAPSTRAGRRLSQWRESSAAVTSLEAQRDIAGRDARDSTRAASPLRAAKDALVLKTDDLTPEEVVERIAQMVETKRRGEG
jgi:cytidylate kinase